jgi:hypothetical protein
MYTYRYIKLHTKELISSTHSIVRSYLIEMIKKFRLFNENELTYQIHKSPLLDFTLSQLNLVHILTLFKIYLYYSPI